MAVGVNIVTTFDSKGIKKALTEFNKLEGVGAKSTYALRTVDQALTNGLVTFAKYGAAAAAAGAIIGKKFIDAASSLEESQSKVGVVFGQSAGEVRNFAETAAKSLGISKQAALEAAGTYGNLFQAFGVGRDQAANMSTTLVQLASDLASFNNTSVEDALQALRSGLSGETEPLKRFGVALNDVRLKQVALNMGLYDGKGTLDVSAKAQAAYALILQDTSLAQGDFARTSDGAANQQRILIASFKDVSAQIGTALMPMFKSLVGFIQESVLPRVQGFADALGEGGVSGGLRFLGGELLNITSNLGPFGTALLAVAAAFTTLRLVSIAAAIAQNLFNVALLQNPIGIAVAAIIAFAVAVAAAYLRFEGFRKVVNSVVNAVISSVEFMANTWIKAINIVITAINAISGPLRAIGIEIPELAKRGEVSFGRLGAAGENAAKRIGYSFERVTKTATARLQGLADFYKKSDPTGGDDDDSGGGVGKTVETAAEKLKKYIAALKDATQAQRQMRDASKGVADANKQVAKASEALTQAQEQFNLITRGYGRESKEASKQQKEVDKAQRTVERSAYRVEQAIFAVSDAEKDLAEARKDGDPQAVREAEIKLAEAKLEVRDATDDQTLASEELAAAEQRLEEIINGAKEGSDAYKEALDALTAAKDAQTDATERAADAVEKERDAVIRLREAEKELAEVRRAVGSAIASRGDAFLAISKAAEQVTTQPTATLPSLVKAVTDPQQTVAGVAAAVTGPLGAAERRAFEADLPTFGTLNVTVNAGMGADGQSLAKQIVDTLKDYERINGYVPITSQYALAV